DAPMSELCPLSQLDFNHLHLRMHSFLGKGVRVETAIGMPAAKITGPDLPHNISPTLQEIFSKATFSCIVIKAADPGTLVQRHHRIFAERAVAHGRYVKNTA